jgi:CheY-like chemotaxis protein
VSVVPNAEDAQKEMKKAEMQLVVTDVKLPGISGLDFAKQLKDKFPHIKVILVSGMNDPEMKEKALATGADAFFPKPVEMRTFLETSSKLLGLIPQTAKLSTRQVIDIRTDLLLDFLINLRQELAAISVTLMDERGKVIGSAGDPPEGNLADRITPYVLSITGTLDRLASNLQPEVPENMFSIRGSQYDLIASPVDGFILLVFLKHAKSMVRMAIVYDALISAIADLHLEINQIGQNYSAETTTNVEKMLSQTGALKLAEKAPEKPAAVEGEQPAVSGDFENLFTTVSKKKLKTEEVESFWESATNKASVSDSKEPGLLSFEEASQLGLTPKEDSGKIAE